MNQKIIKIKENRISTILNIWNKSFLYSPFSCLSWNYEYWLAFKKRKERLLLFLFKKEESKIIFPFKENREGILEFICSHKTDYNYPLILGKEDFEIYNIFFEYLKKNNFRFLFKNIPQGTFFFEYLRKNFNSINKTACPYFYIDNFKETMDVKYLKDIRRNLRKNLNYKHEISYNYNLYLFKKFIYFNKVWWANKGYSGIIRTKNDYVFLNKVLPKMFIEGRAFWSILKDGRKIISILLFFKNNNTIFYYTGGHDVFLKRNSPGKVNIYFLLEKIKKLDLGFKIFDFMRGDESYKKKWNSINKYNYEFYSG